jgi:broad specificity phosphatase PhoE
MILVRHAAPLIDPARPSAEWALSHEGRTQAVRLAGQLAQLAPDALFTSPERKARETAAIVASALGLPLQVVDELREHERRDVPFFASQHAFEQALAALFDRPDERAFGSESAAECLARFRRGVARVEACTERQPVLVTHGTVMSLYLAALNGRDAASLWKQLRPGCFTVLAVDDAAPAEIRYVEDGLS